MNVGVDDSSFFIEALRGNPVSKDFHILDSSSSVSQRNSLYNKGGIFLVTMRILVTDMLSSNIPCEQLTGILVHNAQHICECNQERFVLRMYRERNKTGFIKAFSDDPVSFTHGFCKVQAIMRSLFVRQLFLWPRFHSLVHETLDKYQPNVEEVSMQMSATMKNIQLAIFDLIQCCLQELKRTSKYLDPQTLTIESAILPSFHFYLRSQLQDVWNEIGYVSRQLVYDLKILQNALTSLCRYDCITFSRLVESIRWSETKSNKAGWILTDSADRLFALAKQRLYATEHEGIRSYDFVRCSEENVKLNELRNLLQTFAKTSSVSRPNIIIALDESCCIEIKQFLLSENGTSYVRNKIEEKQNLEINHNKPQVNRKPLAFGQMYIDQYLLSNNQHTNSLSEILLDIDDPPTAICPLSNMSSCQISLIDVLEKCRPLNIIMYDCHLRYIRQIELYCVLHPDCLPTVHCLTFVDSAEEQIYLSTLEREKAAMDELIRQKSQIVIPDDEQLLYSATKPSLAVSKANATRIGGFDRNAGTSDNVSQQKIIIDVRELRSELPSTLYKLNIQLIPVTLEVGDYVLSPEICVERKSLSDLIGSMSDGRLYTQILMMCRHYEKPVLLIEYNKEVEKFSLKDSRFDK
ncbi:hypothetical protein GJ496_001474 [Pomphorhynchus laevis]|nr:hypothetical protein GJ496_001474 [Pomphorhynchus laevis]